MAGRRVTETERLEWRRLYEERGQTVEQIALDAGRAINTVHKALHDAGTQMRPPSRGPTKLIGLDGQRGKYESPLPIVARRPTRSGHRRRGQGLG